MKLALLLAATIALAAAMPSIENMKIDYPACGERPFRPGAPDYSQYVVGGEEVYPPYSYPWMCSIQRQHNGWHFCGGSLIKNRRGDFYLLTAAHCVNSNTVSNDQAMCGAHNNQASNKPFAQTFRFRNVFTHPSYNPNTLRFDVAILELRSQPHENDYVKPVCIANSNYRPDENAIVTGWGTIRSGGPASNILLEGVKPIVSDDDCAYAYRNYGFDRESMMCAGLAQGGVDACQGDSGGPLVKYRNGEWKQVGVVSWGVGCALPGYPGVYADVRTAKPWINEIIN